MRRRGKDEEEEGWLPSERTSPLGERNWQTVHGVVSLSDLFPLKGCRVQNLRRSVESLTNPSPHHTRGSNIHLCQVLCKGEKWRQFEHQDDQ
jgi:hypothetical protein